MITQQLSFTNDFDEHISRAKIFIIQLFTSGTKISAKLRKEKELEVSYSEF